MLSSAITSYFGSYRVSLADHRARRARPDPPTCSGAGPDLHLLKQVEQVTTLVVEGPAGQDSEHRERYSYLYSNCDFGCYFAAETARRGRGRPFAKGGPAMLSAAPGGSTTGPHGLPSRCSAKFGGISAL